MLRVRFAPSPTGYLHIGSARTFIFNWLYARHNGGTVILRLDDTDVERNTQASVDSIFEGLKWLDLGWDEYYRQSDRLELHRRLAGAILDKGSVIAISRRHPLSKPKRNRALRARGCSMPAYASCPAKRAIAGRPRESLSSSAFVCREMSHETLRFAMRSTGRSRNRPRTSRISLCFAATACRRITWPPVPTMRICEISHIIRGQDHLTNTFKHVLIFEALGFEPPQFAHLPLLIAPDGSKIIEAQARPGRKRHHVPRRRDFCRTRS